MICVLCFGETDGYYHYPIDADIPAVVTGDNKPPEYVEAPGNHHGILE